MISCRRKLDGPYIMQGQEVIENPIQLFKSLFFLMLIIAIGPYPMSFACHGDVGELNHYPHLSFGFHGF